MNTKEMLHDCEEISNQYIEDLRQFDIGELTRRRVRMNGATGGLSAKLAFA